MRWMASMIWVGVVSRVTAMVSGRMRWIHACLLAGARFLAARASGEHVWSGIRVPTTTQPRRAHR